MKRLIVKCSYCGAQAMLRPACAVHGEKAKKDSQLYVCSRYPKCNAYVGAHKNTLLPMGTLANGDLRHKRILAHKALDRLWKDGAMKKWQAYKWMEAKLGLRSDQAHIAMFSEYMCDQLIHACQQATANMKVA